MKHGGGQPFARYLGVSVLRTLCVSVAVAVLGGASARADDLRVLTTGVGEGTITSSVAGIDCGSDCEQSYPDSTTVVLTATPAPGSTFEGWAGDCDSDPCEVDMAAARSVRAAFSLATPIVPIVSDASVPTPEVIATYLADNPHVDTPGRFVAALPVEYRQNWILMTRSESLQTGTATAPRVMLIKTDGRAVFTVGLTTSPSYPGADPLAIEYMQWDADQRDFRFHEIVLGDIPARGVVPARSRQVTVDDEKCTRCHSTRNVRNRTTPAGPGTTGVLPGILKAKNKPNWDSYDSWGGMLSFNRDRIYQGSVEAAAFRALLNPWTFQDDPTARAVMGQLPLQSTPPPTIPARSVLVREQGGARDGQVRFPFDVAPPVTVEPGTADWTGTSAQSIAYAFGEGTAASDIRRSGERSTLLITDFTNSDEGRGVDLFDALSRGPNPDRIADELIDHRWATGSVPIDIRPTVMAIASIDCLIKQTGETSDPIEIDLTGLDGVRAFFDARNGMTLEELVLDTERRAKSLTKRKADIQRINLDRDDDVYVDEGSSENGLIQQYGAATAAGSATTVERLRQEVFRRPIDAGNADDTAMGGIYVDREDYRRNTERVALYRYFLEPLGVSVDKWSMGVRGRSRTYTFADLFAGYEDAIARDVRQSLTDDPVAGLSPPFSCADLKTAMNTTLGALPSVDDVPKYTDIQRIFNKSCIECHGGLDYPPWANYGGPSFDLSENEDPGAAETRLFRSWDIASSSADYLLNRMTDGGDLTHPYDPTTADESCPTGLMPCGGPPLSKVDILTFERWRDGGTPRTYGDPHIKTVDGVSYDFQAAGEFVLLRDVGFELQARHSPVQTQGGLGPNAHTGLTSCVSLNTAVAVRLGRHRITYQPSLDGVPNPKGMELRVDGKPRQLGQGIVLSQGGRIIGTSAEGGIRIESEGGTAVVVTPRWWASKQLWYVNIDTERTRASDGLMGKIPTGQWLPALPDGSLLGPRPRSLAERYSQLYDRFGRAWRVTDETSLFDYARGMSTADFTLAGWPLGESPGVCNIPHDPDSPPPPRAQPPLPRAQAEALCEAVTDPVQREHCVLDVSVTGEASLAQGYIAAQAVAANARPTAPKLLFPQDMAEGLPATIDLRWQPATDADGDPLVYQQCVWTSGERPSFQDCIAVAPPQSHVDWTQRWNWWWLLAIALLLAVLAVLLARRFGVPAYLLALVVLLLAVALLRRPAPTPEPPTTARRQLESGQAYLWRVLVEDGKGGTTFSETRRFEVK